MRSIPKRFNDVFCNINYTISKRIERTFSPRCRQAYIALGPTLLLVSLGMAEGYSAIFLPQLTNETQIDENIESWIASIATLPMPFACLLGGYGMETIGRKGLHILNCIICLIGWIVLYCANSIPAILVGRFITGFSVALVGPSTGAYFAETSDSSFRGVSLALVSFALTFGIGLCHFLGTILLHWRNIALICCIFPATATFVMLFAPESPTYLINKRKIVSAIEAFHWCRGDDHLAEKELQILIEKHVQLKEVKCITFSQYKEPEFIKPLLLMLVFFFTLQWCGSNALTFYTVRILEMSLDGQMDEYMSMTIMDIVRIVCSILALYFQNRLGRRPHTFFSTTGVCVFLFALSGALYASRFYPFILKKYSIIILVIFILYMAFLSIGLNTLPWTLAGEVFPLASKGVGNGISTCVNFLFIFFVVKTTPYLFDNLGADGTFLFYGIMTATGLIVLLKFLPETKDKPLHEIEDRFRGFK